MSILTNKRERARFFRFTVVGVIGAVVDFGTFNLLVSLFGLLPTWASVVSFIAAVSNNFTFNRYWTYPDSRTKRVSRQLVEFFLVNLIGLSIRTPVFVLLSPPLERAFRRLSLPLPWGATFFGHNAALAGAVVVVMFWNFYVNRYWTYGDVE